MKVLILLLALLLPACAHSPPEWDRAEKALFGAYVAMDMYDAYQTSLAEERGAEEANPIIRGLFGKHPSLAEGMAFKAAMLLPTWALLHYAPPDNRWRKVKLACLLAIKTFVIVHNEHTLGGVLFRF